MHHRGDGGIGRAVIEANVDVSFLHHHSGPLLYAAFRIPERGRGDHTNGRLYDASFPYDQGAEAFADCRHGYTGHRRVGARLELATVRVESATSEVLTVDLAAAKRTPKLLQVDADSGDRGADFWLVATQPRMVGGHSEDHITGLDDQALERIRQRRRRGRWRRTHAPEHPGAVDRQAFLGETSTSGPARFARDAAQLGA